MLQRKLIVGIGNTGRAFQKIRHNIGKHLLQLTARQLNLSWKHALEAAGSYIRLDSHLDGMLAGQTILYVPTGIINSSGYNVKQALEFFEFDPYSPFQTMLVIHDQMQLKLGRHKFASRERSLKGHNGLKSIQNIVGKESFSRLKVGIGRPESKDPRVVGEYVMEKFKEEELQMIQDSVGRIIHQLVDPRRTEQRVSLLK